MGYMNDILAVLLPPQLKNNGAFVGNTHVDLRGIKGPVRFLMVVGTTDVAIGSGDAATPPFVEQCDTVDGDYTKLPGAELAAVIAATDDNKIFAIEVNLTQTHKRFMRIKAPTAGNATGANLAILAVQSSPGISPASATERGLAAQVIV